MENKGDSKKPKKQELILGKHELVLPFFFSEQVRAEQLTQAKAHAHGVLDSFCEQGVHLGGGVALEEAWFFRGVGPTPLRLIHYF